MNAQGTGGATVAARSLKATSAPSSLRLALSLRGACVAFLCLALAALAFASLPFEHALVATVVASVLVVVSRIDIERGAIPNRIVLPASGVVLIAQLAWFPSRALEWILAPILLALVLGIPGLLGRAWLGMGDAKLGLLLGAGLGWGAFGATVVGFLCVFPAALVVLARGGLAARRASIPFGPFLALGGLIVLLGPPLGGLSSG